MSVAARFNFTTAVTTHTPAVANPLGGYNGAPQISTSGTLSATDISNVYDTASTVGGGGTTTIDVTALTNTYGESFAFTNVKSFHISNTDTTNSIVIGGGSNPLFISDQYTVAPGKDLVFNTVWPVSSGKKNIRLTATAGTKFSILLLGN